MVKTNSCFSFHSALLIKSGLSKEAFIATGVVITCLVNFMRLLVSASRLVALYLHKNLLLLISVTLAAIAGAFICSILLKKITLRFIQVLVTIMLIVISHVLGAGII
jgi:uncharacterized protein